MEDGPGKNAEQRGHRERAYLGAEHQPLKKGDGERAQVADDDQRHSADVLKRKQARGEHAYEEERQRQPSAHGLEC